MRLPEPIRRAMGRLAGRPSVEQRAITSVPWNVGPPLYNRAVTPEQALSLVPVFSAVRLLASQIASLPLQSYRKVADTRTKIPTGSLFSQPAARGTVYDWLHRCVTSLALRGNAYGLVTARDTYGFPIMVEWLHPDHVTVQDTNLSGPGSPMMPLWYWLGRPVPAEDLVHIAWFTMPGKVLGLSPIEACAATVSTGVSAQVYTSDWFNNGAVPPGKFKNTQKTVSQGESDEIKARLSAAIRSRKPLVYGNDWDYEPIAVSAHEARFIETMQLNATQIAAIYGIPPEMLGGQAGGALTYNTVEQNSINFTKFTLRPWLELLEETFSALLPRPQYVKFNLDALLRGDLATRMAAYQIARQIGMNNVDELRSLEEWAPLPNGEGQDYTPLLVQVAASRGIDAAQVKTGGPLSDQPTTDQPPGRRPGSAGTRDVDLDEIDVLPGGRPFGEPQPAPRLISGVEAAMALEARRHDPTDPAHDVLDDSGDLDEMCRILLQALAELDRELSADTRMWGRAWDPAKHPRNPPGPGGGRFRSMVDRLKDSIQEHLKGGGEGHPFESYSREQLRRVARKRGIQLKRGESRDEIAWLLLEHLHQSGVVERPKSQPKSKYGTPAGHGVRRALADAASIEEINQAAEREAKRITGREVRFEYRAGGGMRGRSLDTAREHSEGLLRSLERFPAADLRHVENAPMSANVYAQTHTDRGGIQFNVVYAQQSAEKRYRNSLRKDVAGGYHPKNTDTPIAVAAHEFGHVLDMGTLARGIDRTHGGIANYDGAILVARSRAGRKGRVSRYAEFNTNELIAEAFADVVMNGDNASPLSKDIYEQLVAAYEKKFGTVP